MFETAVLRPAAPGFTGRNWKLLPLVAAGYALCGSTALVMGLWQIAEVPAPEVPLYYVPVTLPDLGGGSPPPPSEPQPQPPIAPPPDTVLPEVVQPDVVPEQTAEELPAATLPTLDAAASSTEDNPGPWDPNAPRGTFVGPGDGSGPVGPGGAEGVPSDPEVPVLLTADMTPPVAIHRVSPAYTETARKVRRQGSVIVRATIDPRGQVLDVQLVKGLGLGLDERAVEALRQWRFTPARRGDRAIAVIFNLTVDFRLN